MSSDAVSADSIALIFEGECPSKELICSKLRESMFLSNSGLSGNFEADIFTYDGRTLVLAYPAPPLRDRVSEDSIRLRRL